VAQGFPSTLCYLLEKCRAETSVQLIITKARSRSQNHFL